MSRLFLTIFLMSAILFSCSQEKSQPEASANDKPRTESERLNKENPAGTYGKGLTLTEESDFSKIIKNPAEFLDKKVLVSGTIVDVCPKRGCWIELGAAEGYETMRVKVVDGQIVFPLSGKGSKAKVEGVVEKLELSLHRTRAYLNHEAEERGEKFDTSSVTEPMTIWRIRGLGAEIAKN